MFASYSLSTLVLLGQVKGKCKLGIWYLGILTFWDIMQI